MLVRWKWEGYKGLGSKFPSTLSLTFPTSPHLANVLSATLLLLLFAAVLEMRHAYRLASAPCIYKCMCCGRISLPQPASFSDFANPIQPGRVQFSRPLARWLPADGIHSRILPVSVETPS